MKYLWVVALGLFGSAMQDQSLVGEWAHPVTETDGADTVVLRFRANGRYDKYVIRVRPSLNGYYTRGIDTLRHNRRWEARHREDSEHSAAHEEVCLEWQGEVSCGWYRFLLNDLYIGHRQLRRRS